jgi:heme oxygenase (biliverdin-IX-beta and delta-forming)
MADSAIEVIRERTRELHEQVEVAVEDLRLLDSLRGLTAHLQTLLHHHRATAHYVTEPELRALVAGRIGEIVSDLNHLGGCVIPDCIRIGAMPLTLSQSLGWVYVVEGSRLGAMVIAKRLERIGIQTEHLRSVGGEAPLVAQRWRSFTQRLTVLPQETWPDAAAAASRSFTLLLGSYQQLKQTGHLSHESDRAG